MSDTGLFPIVHTLYCYCENVIEQARYFFLNVDEYVKFLHHWSCFLNYVLFPKVFSALQENVVHLKMI